MPKPITIVRVTGGYNVFVNDVPVVRGDDGGITIDREKAGLSKGKSKKVQQIIPDDAEPVLFEHADDAKHIAHQIGRYILNMGDLVFSYVSLIGIDDQDAFWND